MPWKFTWERTQTFTPTSAVHVTVISGRKVHSSDTAVPTQERGHSGVPAVAVALLNMVHSTGISKLKVLKLSCVLTPMKNVSLCNGQC